MDFYEAVENRKTVRDFETGTIPTEVFERIISAALKAPTNDHMRDWHYIIIQDKQVIASLLDIIPKGISDEDMEQLIKDWNLSDNYSRSAIETLCRNNIECCLMLRQSLPLC